ncbi:MAG TPA: DNA topoisomerase IB, partial [Candidatus Thermoplasmatota archaeon]|nr:DNA topoisomerase IB [Candidatus Thermoplasmatota archaeon]
MAAVLEPPALAHPAAAKAAGLRYVSDAQPGIERVKRGSGFAYLRDGKPVRDEETLARIRKLAIPPAWTDVWICPSENGHLQATGRDARGRKQYRYHPKWRELRDEAKYHRVLAFGRALPKIRARAARDLRREGLPREKVLAAIVHLLDTTFMRVGNDEYRRSNGSHGLTTLQDHHARIGRGKVVFAFRGKAGKEHSIEVEDARLARIVKHCQDLPGQELFQYLDEEGEVRDVGSADVNEYLRDITGEDFTAKDFRTWAGTVLAAVALQEVATYETKAEAKRNVTAAIERVAKRLGNTPAVCRKCYVHPE